MHTYCMCYLWKMYIQRFENDKAYWNTWRKCFFLHFGLDTLTWPHSLKILEISASVFENISHRRCRDFIGMISCFSHLSIDLPSTGDDLFECRQAFFPVRIRYFFPVCNSVRAEVLLAFKKVRMVNFDLRCSPLFWIGWCGCVEPFAWWAHVLCVFRHALSSIFNCTQSTLQCVFGWGWPGTHRKGHAP